MEGPSLVLATEEFEPFFGRKIVEADGSAKLPFDEFEGQKLREARSWGKHFLLLFDDFTLRIHFLMFGSYRINDRRENREPKLRLQFKNDEINFYSCAIKVLTEDIADIYDWSNDIMADEWDPRAALAKVRSHPNAMVCDVLMDQAIFSGLGNIIKNEALFNLRLHPEATVDQLAPEQQRALVKEARDYSLQFYEWKKVGQLKRNWRIFRKKTCPRCEIPVVKRKTGKGERVSHFCESCQLLPGAAPRKRQRSVPDSRASL